MIETLITRWKQRMALRREYRRLVAEIAALNQADLIDIGAFQADLYRNARQHVYG